MEFSCYIFVNNQPKFEFYFMRNEQSKRRKKRQQWHQHIAKTHINSSPLSDDARSGICLVMVFFLYVAIKALVSFKTHMAGVAVDLVGSASFVSGLDLVQDQKPEIHFIITYMQKRTLP
jgi:hypothetical protein